MDLKYYQQANATAFDLDDDIWQLRELIGGKKTCFESLQGYAWALEQGVDNVSYHYHLLLMYDGSKKKNVWYCTKQFGDRWQQIAGNRGTYFNCHDESYLQQFQDMGELV